jgi:glucokinase
MKLKLEQVRVINDLEANALGIESLSPRKMITLYPGQKSAGNRAIISAGTGLGLAGLLADGGGFKPVGSEGGHGNFGPRNEIEDDLLVYLRGQQRELHKGHVSWERVLSGPGLFNVFDFLRARGVQRQTIELAPKMSPGDAAKEISKAGLDGSCPRCSAALDLFVSLYGSAAGNLALQFLALGGLYVGGGIAPKIIDKLKSPSFVEAFLDKGPLRERVLEKVPVRVIMDDHAALLGAARCALRKD